MSLRKCSYESEVICKSNIWTVCTQKRSFSALSWRPSQTLFIFCRFTANCKSKISNTLWGALWWKHSVLPKHSLCSSSACELWGKLPSSWCWLDASQGIELSIAWYIQKVVVSIFLRYISQGPNDLHLELASSITILNNRLKLSMNKLFWWAFKGLEPWILFLLQNWLFEESNKVGDMNFLFFPTES